ncbi:LpqB family beta-propeller domain-containing protein [Streptomyces sp. NPDC051940]|uniref:LpqB family beta-propeller domain-containing protein n=1 Tax=Streptomyces sp. NPDC051940 TaxID=3155675 RepID=UPI0034333FB5
MGGGRAMRVRLVRVLALAGAGAVLLSSCVGMPDSGVVSAVDEGDKPGEPYARTLPVLPKKDAPARQIVLGFLETLRSDDGDYATARQYLTAEVRKSWTPPQETTVLATAPDTSEVGPARDERQDPPQGTTQLATFRLTGQRIATLDADTGAYRPGSGEYESSVRVVRDKDSNGQWRIATPPGGGLVLSKSDFTRTYGTPVNAYYFTEREPSALVASPVYVRDQSELSAATTEVVRALLRGRGGMMADISRSAFPAGSRLDGRGAVAVTDEKLTVRLKLPADPDAVTCRRMAAQVWYTVRGVAPRVSEVRLRAGGEQLCGIGQEVASQYGTRQLTKADRHEYFYFVDEEQRLVRAPVAGDEREPQVVAGPFAEGKVKIQSIAVSRSEAQVAAVTDGGHRLYTTGMGGSAVLSDPLLLSGARSSADLGFTAPSWDGHGDLWIADRTRSGSWLYWSKGGLEKPQPVEVSGLQDGRIESLRVAAEGARIALVVRRDGRTRLMLGGITAEAGTLRVRDVVEITPQLQDVQAVSWAGDSRLAVVGTVETGVNQVLFVETDGRLPEDGTRTLTDETFSVATSENVSMPLVASSGQAGVVRLPVGGGWEKVAAGGVAPVYPG